MAKKDKRKEKTLDEIHQAFRDAEEILGWGAYVAKSKEGICAVGIFGKPGLRFEGSTFKEALTKAEKHRR